MEFDESTLYLVKSDLPGTRHSLFDLATWKNGLAFKKINFSDTGRPVIKIAELNNGINSNTSFTEGYYGDDVLVRWDDLLFSWSGNPQTSIDVFRYRLQDGWLNQHIFKVTANETFVSKSFLYYILKFLKPYFVQIAMNKQTIGLGHVTIADLKRMSLIVPSKKVQKQIVSILEALDRKIEINNAINENLLKLIKTMCNAWLNEYIPFCGKCPHDWKLTPLSELARFVSGYS
ncbi:restriction endonuclease subunit S, partial [bacterium]|nr:restriction endonuclease subunit S [bacterium]